MIESVERGRSGHSGSQFDIISGLFKLWNTFKTASKDSASFNACNESLFRFSGNYGSILQHFLLASLRSDWSILIFHPPLAAALLIAQFIINRKNRDYIKLISSLLIVTYFRILFLVFLPFPFSLSDSAIFFLLLGFITWLNLAVEILMIKSVR